MRGEIFRLYSGDDDMDLRIQQSSYRKQLIIKFILIISIILISYLASLTDFFKALELHTLDFRFKIRGQLKHPFTKRLVIVEIDERCHREYGKQIPREVYTKLLKTLQSYGAKVVAFDIDFSDFSSTPSDSVLCQLSGGSHRVVYSFTLGFQKSARQIIDQRLRLNLKSYDQVLSAQSADLPFNSLLASTNYLGFVNLFADPIDRKIRQSALIMKYYDNYYPSFALATALAFLGDASPFETPIEIQDQIIFFHSPQYGPVVIPIDNFSQLMINFSGKYEKMPQRFSLVDLLSAHYSSTQLSKIISDNIVLVGYSASDAKQNHYLTPLENNCPGIRIQANVLLTILSHRFFRDSKIINLFFFVFLYLAFLVLLLVKHRRRRNDIVALFFILSVYLVMSALLFEIQTIFQICLPVLIFTLTFIVLYWYDYRLANWGTSYLQAELQKLNLQKRLIAEQYNGIQNNLRQFGKLKDLQQHIDRRLIDQIQLKIDELLAELDIHKRNLNLLSQQKAYQGLDFNTKLYHQIEYEKMQVQKLLQELRQQKISLSRID
jgi:CHASE2 domain-containing sensor protein